ncbi:MAG: hypothetical protein N2043_01720 [Ignavibacterium sp.]|nr:hypothetical protein [Ignavibacterium sp.]
MKKPIRIEDLEKQFLHLKKELKAEANRINTKEAHEYVNQIVLMIDKSLKSVKQINNKQLQKVSQKEFESMIERLQTQLQLQQHQKTKQENKHQIKINIR